VIASVRRRAPFASSTLALALGLLASSCTFFVRAGAGPSVERDGARGGVVAISIGTILGGTLGGSLGPSYEEVVAVGRRHAEPRKTAGLTLRGYGSFGEQGRIGIGGHIGLAFGRDAQIYRHHLGFAVGGGLRVKLAGQSGRFVFGSCGPVSPGDAWGLFLYQDVDYASLDFGDQRLHRLSFPFGLEFRMNSAPDFRAPPPIAPSHDDGPTTEPPETDDAPSESREQEGE